MCGRDVRFDIQPSGSVISKLRREIAEKKNNFECQAAQVFVKISSAVDGGIAQLNFLFHMITEICANVTATTITVTTKKNSNRCCGLVITYNCPISRDQIPPIGMYSPLFGKAGIIVFLSYLLLLLLLPSNLTLSHSNVVSSNSHGPSGNFFT